MSQNQLSTRRLARRLSWETILAALVLIAVAGGMLLNKDFLTLENWSNLLANFVEIALMALPLSLIVITNEIDLSVASTLGLSSSLLGLLWEYKLAMPLAIVISLLVGALCGALNGFLIVRFRLPSLAVTIGTLALFRGFAYIALGDKAVADFPRVARYLYNLGRAYQKLALRPGIGDDERRRALDSARLAYDDAASRRGYISALNDLAVLDEMDDRAAQALDLFRRGAQQGHPLAMYNLAVHYRDGIGMLRDDGQAAEWFARAAGSGLVSALDSSKMAEMMMGGASPLDSSGRDSLPAAVETNGKPRLQVVGLLAQDDAGVPALRGVDFDVRAGEIVGIAAVATL